MRHSVQDYLEKSLLQVRNISRATVFIVPLSYVTEEKHEQGFCFVFQGGRGCFRKTRALSLERANCVTRGQPEETHQIEEGGAKKHIGQRFLPAGRLAPCARC